MPAIIKGMAETVAQLQQVSDELAASVATQDILEGAKVFIDLAKDYCPVDTGFLRASAFIQIGSNDVEFGFGAEYASYVEFGTRKMKAQPYLRPAIDEGEGAALLAIADSVERRVIGKLGKVQVQGGGPSGTLEP